MFYTRRGKKAASTKSPLPMRDRGFSEGFWSEWQTTKEPRSPPRMMRSPSCGERKEEPEERRAPREPAARIPWSRNPALANIYLWSPGDA